MPKAKDLTGQRFGKLVAIRQTDERQHGHIVWECSCDCGNTVFALASSLQSGNTKSCGCAKKGIGTIDITGRRFGRLTAVRPTDERRNGHVIWECKCDCGSTKFVPSSYLRNGTTTSCGCAKGELMDLTGQRFGELTAIRPTEERQHKNVIWECKCDCGNTTFVSTHSLQSGNTKSCGCKKRRDLSGQRFGKLTAIRPTEKRQHGYVVWECKCDCGKTALVSTIMLRSGNTQSCGCLRRGKTSKNRE